MHKIERLLQTLAPKGVEFRKLGDIGKPCMCKRVMKHQTTRYGEIPFYKIGTFGNTADAFISKKLFLEYKTKYSFPKKGDILISASGTIGKAVIYDGKPAYFQDSNIVWIDNDETLVKNDFLFYVYSNVKWNTEHTTILRLYNDNFRNTLIPIPPLEIQQEIVKILDAFTELNTELNTELKARKKQYEYYQNMLLDFKDANQNHKDAKMSTKTYPKRLQTLLQTLAPKGVEFRKLGDIGEYIRGVTYKKNQEINNLECGIKVLRANNITLSNHLNFEDIKVINKNVKIRKEQYLKKNDILICAGSGSSEHIGKVAFIDTDFDYVFGGFMGVIRIREVNSRFVYHIFTSNIFKQYLEKSLNTTTINNLNANILQNFLIPIPPLEIQQEIVKILDAFTELNTELNTELKARKKQYEYYREKLLTFKPLQNKE